MRIDGLWQRDPEQPSLVRPVITAKLLANELALPVSLLVDTGADRTVLGSSFAGLLRNQESGSAETLLSAGGAIASFEASIRLEFQDSQNRPIIFSTSCAVLTDPEQKNTHLLGRDILDYFALICDRDSGLVTLLRPPHKYTIDG